MKIEIEIHKKDLRAAADALTKIVIQCNDQDKVLPIKKILVQLIKKI